MIRIKGRHCKPCGDWVILPKVFWTGEWDEEPEEVCHKCQSWLNRIAQSDRTFKRMVKESGLWIVPMLAPSCSV